MTSVITDRRFGVNASIAIKSPVVAATTANITLSGEQTIDGVAVVADDRVLVKNQTTASENGVYCVTTSTWQRTADWDGSYDIVKGTYVFVAGGTQTGDWRVTTSNPIVIGNTSVAFELVESTFPDVSGHSGQFLQTDGSTYDWAAITESDISDLGSYITSAGVTYENLDTNGDVGTGAGQLAIGNHTHTESDITDLQSYLVLVSDDTSPTLGGELDAGGYDITDTGIISLIEQAAAEADEAGRGQIWVKTATPNELMFTDDAGTDWTVAFTADLTAEDLDVAGDSGTGAIDLDSETFTIAGGTGLDTTMATNTLTIDIDSTVATLTGTQTLTNKTIDTASNTITILEADISDLQSYLVNVVEDTTPQLGGTLDAQSNDITSLASIGLSTYGLSAWHADFEAVQIGVGSVFSYTTPAVSQGMTVTHNGYIDSGNTWRRILADESSRWFQGSGAQIFSTAASGTADGALSWTTQLQLYSTGNVDIPSGDLDVGAGTITASSDITATSGKLQATSSSYGDHLRLVRGAYEWGMTISTDDLYFTDDSGGQCVVFVNDGGIKILERASADPDSAAYGQFWIKDDAPNIPKFTDDGGTDYSIVLDTKAQTLTNKTINTASNTIAIVEADIGDLQSYLVNVSEDTSPTLGGALDAGGYDINNGGVIFLTEQAAAEADVIAKGQIWVKTATPNELMFTDDAGTDWTVAFTADITAEDLDVAGDSGTGAIDLDSETFTIAGGTGLDTTMATNTLTVNIDSTVATLTGSQTLTNKTINTASNTISIVEADIGDLGSYITDVTGDNLSALADVTITSIASGEILKWNGSAWINNTLAEAGIQASGSYLSNVVEDTTPQLGGMLDVNGNSLGDGTLEILKFTETVSAVNEITIANAATGNDPVISATGDDANIGIDISPKGTGNVTLGNFVFDGDATVGAGQDNYVLTYDNASGLIGLEAGGAGGGLSDVVDDTSPTLGGDLDIDGYDMIDGGVITLREQAAAIADVAGAGQIWVKTQTPNELMFTDDTGTDIRVSLIVQRTYTRDTGSDSTTTTIPRDSSAPLYSEGKEMFTHSHTPKHASNLLHVQVTEQCSHSNSGSDAIAALFVDGSGTDAAVAVGLGKCSSNWSPVTIKFDYYMTAGGTSAITFNLRVGGNLSGTMAHNYAATGITYGGIASSQITVTEYQQ